jgi:hypothetical protein
MTVYEGTVITCDAKGAVRGFLVEDRGAIAFVGDQLPERFSGVPRIALGNRSIAPAFADTHIHFMSHAIFSAGLDVRASGSIAETIASVEAFARSRTANLVLGFGASAHSVAENRLPTRSDLDSACPSRPAYIVKYDGHAAVANSRLLQMLPPALASHRGFDAGSGLMTQEAFFRVTDFVTSRVSLLKTLGDMFAAVDAMAANGIGMIHSVAGVGFPMDADVTLESMFARGLANPVTYRLFFQTLDVQKALRRRLPRIGGCFAAALDGCFGSMDAALHQPYAGDSANRGVLYYPDEVVRNFAIRANRAGLQIEMHAIGDRAFDQAVAAISAALADFPRDDHRHTIIHAFLPTQEGLETCVRCGIGVAVQPATTRWDQEPMPYLEEILGDRAHALSPLRHMADMSIPLSGGSDAPCTPPDPILGMWAACNHPDPSQSLTVQEALNLYTRGAARMGFDEKERGSLEQGKAADMVILSANPLAVGPARLREVRVESLLLAGAPYRPGQGMASMLLRAIFSPRRI